MIPIVYKPTRVKRKPATAIYHIVKNCFLNFNFKTVIFKSDISDHFPIRFFLPLRELPIKKDSTYIYERIVNNDSIKTFRQKLYEADWTEIVTY